MRCVFFSTMVVLLMLLLNAGISAASVADMNGMWWDPGKPGMGIYLAVNADTGAVCGSWYLYDKRGNPQWVTFMGSFNGNLLSTGLYRFTGPSMGDAWDHTKIYSQRVGEVSIDFSDSAQLNMSYTIDGIAGTMSLVKFSSDEFASTLWWDVHKQGQGVSSFHFTNLYGQDQLGIVWYVYDSVGNCTWYTAIGDPSATVFDVMAFTGPPPGDPWDGSLVRSWKAGTVSVDFSQGHGSPVDIEFVIDGVSSSLSLEPFVCPVAVPQ